MDRAQQLVQLAVEMGSVRPYFGIARRSSHVIVTRDLGVPKMQDASERMTRTR